MEGERQRRESSEKRLSRQLQTQLEIKGPVYPLYVYDRNRPLTPILKQRWCSLMYDVY
jgi:hypothetical protein